MENQTTLLLVDDDQDLCDMLGEYLGAEGFHCHAVHSGQEALQRLGSRPYDAVVLDVMMPGLSGLEVLARLRPGNTTPVLMLTGKGDDIDRILGLEMGADDYLGKPCNPRELVARIRAVLRRSQPPAPESEPVEDDSLSLHGITIVSGSLSASVANTPLSLTSAEFHTLALLMRNAGKVLSKEQLTEQVLHRPLEAYDRSMDVHISRVRQKLAAAGLRDIIKSVRGVGYQMLSESNP